MKRNIQSQQYQADIALQISLAGLVESQVLRQAAEQVAQGHRRLQQENHFAEKLRSLRRNR